MMLCRENFLQRIFRKYVSSKPAIFKKKNLKSLLKILVGIIIECLCCTIWFWGRVVSKQNEIGGGGWGTGSKSIDRSFSKIFKENFGVIANASDVLSVQYVNDISLWRLGFSTDKFVCIHIRM